MVKIKIPFIFFYLITIIILLNIKIKNIYFNFSDVDYCMVKDYLNFYCETCSKNLCKEHYHLSTNCPNVIKNEINGSTINNNIKTNESNFKQSKCDFCNKITFNHENYKCQFCSLGFCLQHRLESDHKCTIAVKIGKADLLKLNKNKFKEKLELLNKKK